MTGFFFFFPLNGELCDVTVTGVYIHCVKFKWVTDQLANVNELLLFCTALWYRGFLYKWQAENVHVRKLALTSDTFALVYCVHLQCLIITHLNIRVILKDYNFLVEISLTSINPHFHAFHYVLHKDTCRVAIY